MLPRTRLFLLNVVKTTQVMQAAYTEGALATLRGEEVDDV